MSIRRQLIRAAVALLIIAGVATAETLSTPATDVDCPFAKVARPQRILLLDPIQRHPTFIDAHNDSTNDRARLQETVDLKPGDASRGVVAS